MNDEPTTSTETRRPSLTWALWLAFILLVVYPLSTGPAVVLVDKGVLPKSALDIYAPVAILAYNWPPADRFFDWYLKNVWHWSPPFK